MIVLDKPFSSKTLFSVRRPVTEVEYQHSLKPPLGFPNRACAARRASSGLCSGVMFP